MVCRGDLSALHFANLALVHSSEASARVNSGIVHHNNTCRGRAPFRRSLRIRIELARIDNEAPAGCIRVRIITVGLVVVRVVGWVPLRCNGIVTSLVRILIWPRVVGYYTLEHDDFLLVGIVCIVCRLGGVVGIIHRRGHKRAS